MLPDTYRRALTRGSRCPAICPISSRRVPTSRSRSRCSTTSLSVSRRSFSCAPTRPRPNMKSLDSQWLDPAHGGINYVQDRIEHQNLDWYGKKMVGGVWQDQPAFNEYTNRTTGFWHNWYGNAEGIIRETYTRAIEVSLGIPHDPAQTNAQWIANNMVRAWPIEIFNRCPAPWFEGWVTWRDHPPTRPLPPPGQTVAPGRIPARHERPRHGPHPHAQPHRQQRARQSGSGRKQHAGLSGRDEWRVSLERSCRAGCG